MTEQPPLIVGIDAQTLIWGWRDPPEDCPGNMHQRAKWLIENLDRNKAQIVFPTVALNEILVGVEPDKHDSCIAALSKRLLILPFDTRAASLAAKHHMENVDLKDHGGDNARKVFKSDMMIVATARIAGATDFYSHDGKCRKIVERFGMRSHNLPTRPIVAQPTSEQQGEWAW